ncbi:toxin-antitoxin system YwqK family antitoxin [Streptomyces libani]|uniref:toxin-antitoxin system YwqK family antitoxin n=1 Tax=Streptomyces TaxID=1883 RepID=UPI00140F4359|nr:hypothetical protein [Streptomyces sp. ID38640]QIK08860.1 hypothetical protein G7Z12_25415 [Streptomyces sp. ID38640]
MKTRIEEDDCDFGDDMLVYHNGEPLTGEVVTRDAEGRMISLVHYVGGITSGPQTHWYADGSKKTEGTVMRGEAVGEWRSWHANGQLSEYTLFSQHGEYMRRQRWDKDGNLTVDKSYTA